MRCKSKARKLTQNDEDDVHATASIHESLTSDASEDERADYGDDEADEELLVGPCSSDDDNNNDGNGGDGGDGGGGGRPSLGGPLSMATRPASSALCLLEDASLPNELELRESQVHGLGVWSRVHLSTRKKFGPFLGKLRAVPLNPTYAWQVIDGTGRVSGWVDASEPGVGNWMKYVRTNSLQQNLRPFLCKGQIFYQVTQDIEVGEELLLCDKKTLFPELDDLLPSESEDNKTGGDNLSRPSDGGLFDFDFSQHSEFSDPLGFSQDSSSPEPRQGTHALLFGLNTSSADQGNQNSDPSRVPYKCVACEQSFSDVVRLDEHMLIDHYGQDNSSGEYKCDQCPKVFSWKSNLIRHQAAHEEGRRYVCENCHKVFTDPSNLQRHIRSQHIGARSHACPECGKTFATSSGLKQHTHIHSSVKPFQCEVCLKSYTQFSNLCRHKRMHADCRMQIKCHKCGQAFSTVTSLSKHKRFCEGGIHSAATSGSAATAALLNAFSPHPPSTGLHGTSGASTNDKASPMSLTHHSQPGNPLMFYPRTGFSFYPHSLVAYPMFSGATAGLPPHPSLLAANSLLMPGSAKKPDSPDSSQATGSGATQVMNGSVGTEVIKKEKRASEGSESEISDDVSSAGISDDVDMSTGSELDSESEGDRIIVKEKPTPVLKSSPHPESVGGGLVISPREHSPKQAAIYPELGLKDSMLTNGMLKSLTVSCPPADMPFDLSVSSKAHAQHMSPAAKPVNETSKEDEPLDLRVDHKKAPKIEENPLHKTHVFGEKKEIPERRTPVTPVSIHETTLSPNKFQMAHPRPIHPLLVNPQLYKPKYPAFPTNEPMMMPLPPRYPFLSPLMNGLNGSASAFDMIRSQMEKMGKPYQDVLAPHVNKLKERYSCKFCGKIFPRSANLTRHLRTHTGEQPYKCKYCERSFSISSNLQRHVRNIHNKEKPFKCPLCDRCFGQQTNLDRHLKKHESDGPTILDDSPKSSDLNEKDETYFDEIRNFIGKVTDHGPSITSSPVSLHPYPAGKRASSPGEEAIPKRHRRMSEGVDERSPLSREERESPPREESPSPPCRTSSSPQVAYEVTMQVNGNGSDKSVGSESRETSVSPFCNDLSKTMANHEKAVEV